MSPESYFLEEAINSLLKDDSQEKNLNAAILQYAKYQRISLKVVSTVFTTGFN